MKTLKKKRVNGAVNVEDLNPVHCWWYKLTSCCGKHRITVGFSCPFGFIPVNRKHDLAELFVHLRVQKQCSRQSEGDSNQPESPSVDGGAKCGPQLQWRVLGLHRGNSAACHHVEEA